jgi:hypothetical protein
MLSLLDKNNLQKKSRLNCANCVEDKPIVFSKKQDSAANVWNNNTTEILITDVMVSH